MLDVISALGAAFIGLCVIIIVVLCAAGLGLLIDELMGRE